MLVPYVRVKFHPGPKSPPSGRMFEETAKAIIHQYTQGRLFGIIIGSAANVLEVNLSLNQEQK